MSWITFIWALATGACVIMALPHLVVGLKDRARENLFFVLAALSGAAIACGELAIMHSRTPAQIGRMLQLVHAPLFLLVVAIVGFVYCSFGTGRLWLGLTAVLARFIGLCINFAFPPNVNYREITFLRQIDFLGETVALPGGIPSPSTRLIELSSLLLLAYVIDASITLWRRGGVDDRRRAAVLGGSISIFIFLAAGLIALLHARLISIPYLISLPFLGVILAMGAELTFNLLQAAQTTRQLRISEGERKRAEEAVRESDTRFQTVADVAPVMIWMSGPDKAGIFFNKGWLAFTGRTAEEELGEGWLKGIHPDDLSHTLDVCGTAFRRREPFTVEYRLRNKDGAHRWLLDTGTPRFDADGNFLGYVGSCIDIGERKQAELDRQLQSMELARVGRLALMGELGASLAHEVFNPLAAMVTNASVGQRLLARGELEAGQLSELLGDIVADGHRARRVIEGIRNMVRKGSLPHTRVDIGELARELLHIVRTDAVARKVNLIAEIDETPGVVVGDRVQLLQVLLNLTLNAFEAVMARDADKRRVVIRAHAVQDGKICLSVGDVGPGFSNEISDRLFEPFFSTKADGTGMGLAIARSIVEAHGGALTGENLLEGGALFTICLPEAREPEGVAA